MVFTVYAFVCCDLFDDFTVVLLNNNQSDDLLSVSIVEAGFLNTLYVQLSLFLVKSTYLLERV